MIIDCGTCQVAGLACGDCVVTVLLGPPAATVRIADDHHQALVVLCDSGLIPPLRLVSAPGTESAPSRPEPRAMGQ